MLSMLVIFFSQFANSSLFSRLESKKIHTVKIIRKNPKRIPYKLGANKNKITKNKIDLNSTWYLKTDKIEKE